MKSQTARLVSHLKQGKKISALSAYPILKIVSFHRRMTEAKAILAQEGRHVVDRWTEYEMDGKHRIKVYWSPR